MSEKCKETKPSRRITNRRITGGKCLGKGIFGRKYLKKESILFAERRMEKEN